MFVKEILKKRMLKLLKTLFSFKSERKNSGRIQMR